MHFTDSSSRIIYTAISSIMEAGGKMVDAYNILEYLNATPATQNLAAGITIEQLQELIDDSPHIARDNVTDYKTLVSNIMNAAFRRDTWQRLAECQRLCTDPSEQNLAARIYDLIDDITTTYTIRNEIPLYRDVVDAKWEEIKSRQGAGYAGIPFPFQHLNDYVTIENGELVIFAAEAKQGKSMFLLNCAADLLRQGKSVLYLDSELNTRMFTARLLSHMTGITYKRLTSGAYSDEEAEWIDGARAWLKEKNFVHIYIPMFSLETVYAAVKKVDHMFGHLDVLVVDYFKSSGEGDAFATYNEMGKFVDMVKNKIAGDMGIAAIGAAQATSTGKLADSAKIVRNASTICLLQSKTPEEMEVDGPECGNKKLTVVFNRNGMQMAAGEYIDFNFDGNHVKYEEAQQHIPITPF